MPFNEEKGSYKTPGTGRVRERQEGASATPAGILISTFPAAALRGWSAVSAQVPARCPHSLTVQGAYFLRTICSGTGSPWKVIKTNHFPPKGPDQHPLKDLTARIPAPGPPASTLRFRVSIQVSEDPEMRENLANFFL